MSGAQEQPDQPDRPDAFVRVKGGIAVSVPDDLQELGTYVLREQEDWFEEEIELVRAALEPGDLFIDIGANYGIYSLNAARAVGPEGRVVAFEPGAAPARHLRRSAEANQFTQLEVVSAALSDRCGTGRLSADRDAALAEVDTEGTSDGEAIALLTLDQADADLDLERASFLKMDAEGHEPRIIAGGPRFFARATPLCLVEVRAGDKLDLSLPARLMPWGYRPLRLVPGLGQLAAVAPDEALDPFVLNLFVARPDRLAALAARGLVAGALRDVEITTRWGDALERYPLVRPAFERWDRAHPAPGWSEYERCLAAWVAARAAETPAEERLSLLAQARWSGEAAFNAAPSLARAITLGRVCADFGHRSLAVKVLMAAAEAALQDAPFPDEPFLPPSPPLELVDPGPADPRRLLMAAVLERFERLRAHSGLFVGPPSLSLLDRLVDLGFGPPEMERRQQLVRLRAGMQDSPRPSPRLIQEGADNLNPAFWSGIRG
jgi:FkbM family methyltransferase